MVLQRRPYHKLVHILEQHKIHNRNDEDELAGGGP
jgi:hypothetical protein